MSTSNPLSLYTPTLSSGTWRLDGVNYTNSYSTTYGTGTQGIDCSDLTSLAYNVAAGIHLDSAVGSQGLVNPTGNGGSGSYSNSSPMYWNTLVCAGLTSA